MSVVAGARCVYASLALAVCTRRWRSLCVCVADARCVYASLALAARMVADAAVGTLASLAVNNNYGSPWRPFPKPAFHTARRSRAYPQRA